MAAGLQAYKDEVVKDARAAWKQAAREKEQENIEGIYGVINEWLAGKTPLPSEVKGLITRVTGFDEFNMGGQTKNRFLRALKGFEEEPDEAPDGKGSSNKGPGKELVKMYARDHMEEAVTAIFERRLPGQTIATLREALPEMLYESVVENLGYSGEIKDFVLENYDVFHDFENTVTRLANENANIQGRFLDYKNAIAGNIKLQAMFKNEYRESAELINKDLTQRFFDIMMSSDLARITDTELKKRLDEAIAAVTGENLRVVRQFNAQGDNERDLARMHHAVDSNSELVVRNRTEAPKYLRGFDSDPEIYRKQIEEMYKADMRWIGRSVPGLDINQLTQVNKQDAAGDDEDAAGIYQYAGTGTFYRVTAEGDKIKIEKQDAGTRGNAAQDAWEPVEANRLESTFKAERSRFWRREAEKANTESTKKIAVGTLASRYEMSPRTPRLTMGGVTEELQNYSEDEIRQVLSGWQESGVLVDGKGITDINSLIRLIRAGKSR
jgi:hypothetical protein